MRAPRPPAPTASWFRPTSFRVRRTRFWRPSSSDNPPLAAWRGHAAPSTVAEGPMKILVANLGSTSFKYRLFDMRDENLLARGGVERIGSPQSRCFVEAAGQREETIVEAKDHA